jgi:membrane associated rhomboid family serine protease
VTATPVNGPIDRTTPACATIQVGGDATPRPAAASVDKGNAVIIPIGHDQQIRGLPWATFGIIAVCTLVQIYSSAVAPSIDDVQRMVAQAPDHALAMLDKIPMFRFGYQTGSGINYKLLTCAFVHAGWLHLIGNMLFLWLAGSVLEDRWGRVKFVVFYLGGAAASTLCFDWLYDGDRTILVGASGAISAAMGAFLVYYHRAQIRFFYWWWTRTGTFFLSAYVALPVWLAEQLLWAKLEPTEGFSGTAYTAHIGGFAFGAVVALVASKLIGRNDVPVDNPDFDDPIPAATAMAATIAKSPAKLASPPDPERVAACMTAIEAGDAATVRTLGSRTVIDLSRAGQHARVVELYQAITKAFSVSRLTDGALVAAANAADAMRYRALYIAIVDTFMREQPDNRALPELMWRAMRYHTEAGRHHDATDVLEALVARFPRDPIGVQANAMLGQRRR